MHAEVERVYMDLLVEIGRAGNGVTVFLVWSKQKHRFMNVREKDYRAELIGQKYDWIGTYKGGEGLPFYSEVCEDINAFIQEETQKEHGCRPELQRLPEAG